MASFEHDGATIHFDDEGNPDGPAVLLIAPGGMRSANDIWATAPWNPRERLAASFRLIGMDQRNAGRSTAPISAEDGWSTYTADQLALLDHLGIDRCMVVGMCIGGPYIAGLLVEAPERFSAAVMLQPVGIDDNRDTLYEMFDNWATIHAEAAHRAVTPQDWASFRSNMWDGEFLLTASPAQVEAWDVPVLVAMGNDIYHPQSTSRAIAEAGKQVTFVEEWKQGEALAEIDATIHAFLSGAS